MKNLTYIILLIILIAILILLAYIYFLYNSYKSHNKEYCKFKRNFLIMDTWLNEHRVNDNFIADKLKNYGYKSVAIYGCGYLGLQLYKDLKKSGFHILYFIDEKTINFSDNLKICKPTDDLPAVDVIIITVVSNFFNIKSLIEKKSKSDILSLEDLI